VSFTNAAAVSTIINNCAAATYSLASYSWNFGDPLSGAANNTSTAQNPKHQYSSTGTFTTTLVLNYQCYSDTLKQTVNVSTASPTFAVSGATAICKGEKTIYTASGAQNYTWAVLPSAVVNASIALNPTLTTQYTVSATNSLTGCRWDYVFALTVNKCLNIENTNTVFNHLAVFPNPVKEMLHVEMDILNENTSAVDIEISNALGQIVYSEKLTQAKTDINTAQWAKGIYFMKVKDAEKEGVKRIVVE
jgi:PKD repeat protein